MVLVWGAFGCPFFWCFVICVTYREGRMVYDSGMACAFGAMRAIRLLRVLGVLSAVNSLEGDMAKKPAGAVPVQAGLFSSVLVQSDVAVPVRMAKSGRYADLAVLLKTMSVGDSVFLPFSLVPLVDRLLVIQLCRKVFGKGAYRTRVMANSSDAVVDGGTRVWRVVPETAPPGGSEETPK